MLLCEVVGEIKSKWFLADGKTQVITTPYLLKFRIQMLQRIRLWLLLHAFSIFLLIPLVQSRGSLGARGNTPLPDLYEASIAELQDGLQKGLFTSVDLVKVSIPVKTLYLHTQSNLIVYRPTLRELMKSISRVLPYAPF